MREDEKNDKAQSGDGDNEFIPTVSGNGSVSEPGSDSMEQVGEQIGPYKLLEVLGEGGYGIVYLAEQQKPIKRRVALKVIKPGMDSKQVIGRFEAERQALALLDHPNIAHVFDAGTTKAGRPYFVMEYVKGISLTNHCDQEKLSIEQRLELFLQVCEAVHYAHQKGIIHRDIKPSNILVSIEAGKALPKIIDFGIAKALTQPLTERTFFTEQGQLIGTPAYMSPEQAEMANEDIDTRSDIYSLGVLLYSLLTGALPFDRRSLQNAAFAEMLRIIREEDPPHPSTRLSTLGEEARKIAENRRTELATLAKCLHRELEWIPLKAMRKERSHRYQSASDLASDIRNYLGGSPLIAGPESAAYRLRKFVRRHQALVTGVAAVLVVLAAGVIVSLKFAVSEHDARVEAQQEAEARRRALAETDKARKAAELAGKAEANQRKDAEKAKEETEAALLTARQNLYWLTFEKENSDIPQAAYKGVQPLHRVLLWENRNVRKFTWRPLGLCDMDGDGCKDIGTCGYWYSGVTGKLIDNTLNLNVLLVDDLDGDNVADRLVAKGNTLGFFPSKPENKSWFQHLPDQIVDFWGRNNSAWYSNVNFHSQFVEACSTIDIDDDGVYDICTITKDGFLLCLSGNTGSVIWVRRYEPGSLVTARGLGPDQLDGVILVSPGTISLLEMQTGKVFSSSLFKGLFLEKYACTVADVHSAEGNEIVQFINSETIQCLSGVDFLELWHYSGSHSPGGRAVQNFPYPTVCPTISGAGLDVVAVFPEHGKVIRLDGSDGTPIWEKTIGAWCNSLICLYDINNDKIADVILSSSDGLIQVLSGSTGELIRKYPLSGPEFGSAMIFVTDFVGDGTVQMAALTYDGSLSLLQLSVPKAKWARKFHIDRLGVAHAEILSTCEDVDNDGITDAIVQPCLDGVGLCSGVCGEVIWLRKDLRAPAGGIAHFGMDVDRDGKKDIIALCCKNFMAGQLMCLSSMTGDTLWEFETKSPSPFTLSSAEGKGRIIYMEGSDVLMRDMETGDQIAYMRGSRGLNAMRKPPVHMDIDKDGKKEFILYSGSLVIYECDLSSKIAAFEGRWCECIPAFHDVDGDGVSEMICWDRNGVIHCLSIKSKSYIWSTPTDQGYQKGASIAPSCSVAVHKGTAFIVTGGWRGGAYCLRADDGTIVWTADGPDRSVAAPIVRDIDGDNVPEINLADVNRCYSFDLKTGSIKYEFPLGLPFGFLDSDDGSPFAVMGYADQSLLSYPIKHSLEKVVWPSSHKVTSLSEARRQGNISLESSTWPNDAHLLDRTTTFLPQLIDSAGCDILALARSELEDGKKLNLAKEPEKALACFIQAVALGETASETFGGVEKSELKVLREYLERQWRDLAYPPKPKQSVIPEDNTVTSMDRIDQSFSIIPQSKKFVASGWKASWSPDGTQMVCGKGGEPGLQVINLISGEIVELTDSGKDPAWSPDGRFIAYVMGNYMSEEVWLINTSSGSRHKLVSGGFPSWAKDGKRVFVHSRKENKILAVEIDDPNAEPQVYYENPLSIYPAISPDGRKIAFGKPGALVVINRETDETVLTWTTPGTRGLLPAWSPDGKRIAFGSFGIFGLWVLDVETQEAVQVATGWCTMPAWSPDGTKLAFDRRRPGARNEVWIVETKDLAKLKPSLP